MQCEQTEWRESEIWLQQVIGGEGGEICKQ